MGCKYICDHCGKEAPAKESPVRLGHWMGPPGWYGRGGITYPIQDACSEECANMLLIDRPGTVEETPSEYAEAWDKFDKLVREILGRDKTGPA
jgi:hypothetical protein